MKLLRLMLLVGAAIVPTWLWAQSMDVGATAVTIQLKGTGDTQAGPIGLTINLTDLNGAESATSSLTARVLPGRTYIAVLHGQYNSDASITIDPPSGYLVQMANRQLNSMVVFTDVNSPDNATTVAFSIVPADDLTVLPAGASKGPLPGEVFWEAGLGSAPNGLSVGRLALISDGSGDWTNLISTSALSFIPTSAWIVSVNTATSGGEIEYVAPQCMVDVLQTSSASFTVNFYNPSQGHSISGAIPYGFNGETPFMTYTIAKVGTTELTISSTATSGAGSCSKVADILENTSTHVWTVVAFHDSSSSALSTATSTVTTSGSGVGAQTTVATSVKDSSNVVSDSSQKVYTAYAWGNELTSETHYAGSTPLTTIYDYYSDSAYPGHYTQVKSVTYPSSRWESWNYLDEPQGLISTHYESWCDSPGSVSFSSSQGKVTSYTYDYDADPNSYYGPPLAKARPTSQTTTINGTTSTQWSASSLSNRNPYSSSTTLKLNGLPLVATTRQDYAASGGTSQQSVYLFYREDSSAWLYPTMPCSLTKADGTKDSYGYDCGTWNSSTNTFTAQSGLAGAVGAATRVTIFHGCSSSISGSTSISSIDGGQAIDPVYVVPGKSTKEVTIRDGTAYNVVRTETWVWASGAWVLISWTNNTYDPANQLTQSSDSTGAVYSATWQGDFKKTETDPAGITTTYTNDNAWRVQSAQVAAAGSIGALTTQYSYDASNRMVSKVVGSGQSETLTTNWVYDTAGRLTSKADPGNSSPGIPTTTYQYPNNGRDLTTTYPDGGTKAEAYYLDGQRKSVTGTAVVPEYFGYDIQSGGAVHTMINYGSSGSSRLQETWTDMLGRTIKTSRPGFNGVPSYVELSTYDTTTGLLTKLSCKDGNNVKIKADTLYQYDEMARLAYTSLDLDGSGLPIALGGNNRITGTVQVIEQLSGQWWSTITTTVFPIASSSTPITNQVSHRRLTGLGGSTSYTSAEQVDVDIYGNSTDTVTSVDTSQHKITTSTTTAGSSHTKSVVSIDGLATQVTGFDGLSATTSYDGLWRPHQVTDSRSNVTTSNYLAGTTWVSSTVDATSTTVAAFQYDIAGRVVTETNGNGHVTRTVYDHLNHVTNQWGDAAYPVSYGYDVYGSRTSMSTFRAASDWNQGTWPSNPGSADTTTWGYDSASGLLSSKTDAATNAVTYAYNSRGQTSTRTWARGVTTTYGYDSNSADLLTISYSDSTPTVTYTYTRTGQLNSVKDGTNVPSNSSDIRSFIYDSHLLLQAEDLGPFYNNRVFSPQYNSDTLRAGRPTGFMLGTVSSFSADLAQTYTYNSDARFDHLASTTGNGSNSITFSYGYLSNSSLVNQMQVASSGFNVAYSYETNRDLMTGVQTSWGTVSSSNPALAQFTYAYDPGRQRLSAQQTGLAFKDYYDGTSYSSVFNYYAHDGKGQLTAAAMYRGTAPTSGLPSSSDELPGRRFQYQYDNLGNRIKSGPVDPLGTAAAADDQYSSNNLNQYASKTNYMVRVLGNAASGASVTVTGTPVTQLDRNYGADVLPANSSGAVAAQVTVTSNMSTSGGFVSKSITRNYVAGPVNQNFTYDGDGNLIGDPGSGHGSANGIWNYVYDGENRLVEMNNAQLPTSAGFTRLQIKFKYDYLNRRVEKQVFNLDVNPTQTVLDHKFIYDGWNLIAETDASGSLLRSYAWGLDVTGDLKVSGGVGALLEVTNFVSGSPTDYFPAYDGNGNVVALINAGGSSSTPSLATVYEYSPFGETLRAEVFDSAMQDAPFRFSTKYTDVESGLAYYGNRYYAAALGRFINRDTIEEAGGVNLYGFVSNDPVSKWDVLGNFDPNAPNRLPTVTVYGDPVYSGQGGWGWNSTDSSASSQAVLQNAMLATTSASNALNINRWTFVFQNRDIRNGIRAKEDPRRALLRSWLQTAEPNSTQDQLDKEADKLLAPNSAKSESAFLTVARQFVGGLTGWSSYQSAQAAFRSGDILNGLIWGAVGIVQEATFLSGVGAVEKTVVDGLASLTDSLAAAESGSGQMALTAGKGYNPWTGAITSDVTAADTRMFRVWGDGADKVGGWLTPTPPASQLSAIRDLALPVENSAQWISEVTVPAGTRFQVGTAAGAFGQPGGGTQILLLERIPPSNFGPGTPLGPR